MECKGDDLLEETIRIKLKEILGRTDSVIPGRPDSAISGFDRLVDKPDNLTVEQWRRKAIFYQERLEQLQANLRSALSLSEVSMPVFSSKPGGEREGLLDEAEASTARRRAKP